MAFELLINGVDYICDVFRNSVNIRESLQANGASMQGKVQLIANANPPVAGQEVKFYRDGNLEFAGRITTVNNIYEYGVPQYEISCVDYTPDFDAQLIQDSLPQTTAGAQAKRVIALVGRGFTSTGVATGPIVGAQDVDYEYPSAVLSRISESVEHQWYIGYDRDVKLFYILDRPAPVTSIDFDTNTVDYADLEFEEDASQVKNVIALSGGKVKSQAADLIASKADGDQRFWPLNYEPWSVADTVVTVDNIPQTVKLDGIDSQAGDGGGASGEVYLCLDNWGVRWPDASPPAEDSVIGISYRYAYEPLIFVEDAASIAFMKARENTATAPSNGRHELKFQIPDIRVDSEDTIVDYGNLLLTRYGYPIYTIKFTSLTQGWAVGQNFTGVSAVRGLSTQIYVTSVTKTIWRASGGEYKFKYAIDASSSPFPV